MDNQAGGQNSEENYESELIDLPRILSSEAFLAGDTVLASSLRRILAELNNPEDVVAGHNSSP